MQALFCTTRTRIEIANALYVTAITRATGVLDVYMIKRLFLSTAS
jgi:hypothetical protein